MSGLFSGIFGGSSKSEKKTNTVQTTQDAIQQLRNTEDILNKKIEQLEGEIKEASTTALRLSRIDKRNALNALKRKKRAEKTLQQVDETLTTLECQRETLQNAAMNVETFDALRTASNALQKVHQDLGVTNIEDILDDLREQNELSEQITGLISNPIGLGVEFSQKEIEDELEELAREGSAHEPSIPNHFPSVPISTSVSRTNHQGEKDDLRLLEELAS